MKETQNRKFFTYQGCVLSTRYGLKFFTLKVNSRFPIYNLRVCFTGYLEAGREGIGTHATGSNPGVVHVA